MCASTSRIPYTGILAVLVVAVMMGLADAEIGYDCAGKIQTMTIPLVDNCDLHIDKVETSIEEMALLQLNDFKHINIVQCKVEIHRYIHWCGNTAVKSVFHDYLEAISHEDCLNAIRSGSFNLRDTLIDALKHDEINERQITFAGSKKDNETCVGADYSDPYGTWKNVVATGKAFISLSSQSARTKVKADKILLPSGNQCKFSKGECVDSVGGYTFWDALPRDNCNANTYSLLYKGTATQYKSNVETVYTVNVDDTSFSFTAIGTETSCGATLLKTESSNLFWIQSDDLKDLEESNVVEVNTSNFNIFRNANAEFVYVEKHKRSQVRSLYLEVLRHRCELKKEILNKTLPVAYTQSDEFAFRYMHSPGYTAVVAEQVIHIVQCIPVEVKINHLDKCYNRLPVLRSNQSVFLTPRTHIITSYATEVPCSSPLLEHYKLSGAWYQLTPRVVSTREPMKLKPSTKLTWTNLSELVALGIYTQEDLDSMRERIMFPLEQNMILKTLLITNRMRGSPCAFSDEIRDEKTIWLKAWGKFVKLGDYCSYFIGVLVCFVLLKTVADFVLYGFRLYKAFGFSIYLIGACWGSLANTLLDKAKKKETPKVGEATTDREIRVPDRIHGTRAI